VPSHNVESTTADRRGFFRKVAGLGLGLATLSTGGCAAREGEQTAAPKGHPKPRKVPARVVEVRSEHCFDKAGHLDKEVLAALLDTAMKALFGVTSADSAWESLVTETDTVGLKVNCLAGPGLSSRPELARAIAAALGVAGVRENAVIAWDRQDDELLKAGYELNDGDSGMRCFGTDHPGYGNDRHLVMNGKIGGFLSSILTRHTTATINIPVLKDHGIVGISGSLKNNFGCIHNPNKYHPNCGDPYAADLNALPQIRDKQRLVVCDATTLQYQGGPGYKPQWAVRSSRSGGKTIICRHWLKWTGRRSTSKRRHCRSTRSASLTWQRSSSSARRSDRGAFGGSQVRWKCLLTKTC